MYEYGLAVIFEIANNWLNLEDRNDLGVWFFHYLFREDCSLEQD